MTLSKIRTWSLLLAVLALAACQSNPRPAASGFLGGNLRYDRMVEVEGTEGLWTWRSPWRPGTFTGAIVSPVEVRRAGTGGLAPEDLATAQSLADHFQSAVQRVTSKHFPLTAAPGPDALIIMAAVIGMDPTQPAANLAPTGRGSDERERAGHVEMKVINGGTGATLASLLATGPIPPADVLPGAPAPNTKAILSDWAALLDHLLAPR